MTLPTSPQAAHMSPMRSVDEHLGDILRTVRALAPLELELERALGTTLAEEVTSPVPLPPFDNSAMDGYAVRAEDVADVPATLPVVDDVAAGDGRLHALGPGMALRIMTGAPLPAGANAVVPVEWTDGGTARVTIDRPVQKGNAIRLAGEDVRAGEVVLTAGTRIGPAQLGILAGVGRRRVLVRPRPRVVVISTGAELAEPGTTLAPGQIWESNSYTLIAAVREAGGEGYRAGIVGDDAAGFAEQLDAQLVRADVVITSGGVSMGAYEPVKEALGPLGTVRFERVAMQPGMPQGFGVVGDDQVPIFALPGNPVSSFVSFMLFVRPALRKMQGLPAGPAETATAVTAAPLRSPAGKRSYLRGKLGPQGAVTPVRRQGSHQLAALAEADALIVVPEDVTELPEGTTVEIIPL
ncbi:molybdopterin biosynthesis protein MoeA [Planomonospora sphaerica]|uniref:Molybdopterin molybdenumtransferase n=4 Tax=Streptosporangiaceae TaxID=2004 RepID=A0A161LLC3_9ACTN|nr:molybdopterin biosynthesis protein MoeA [Planomonospora sphaerica]GGK69727.1 molybdopterin molybdenumtransferase MoeA [Planomonospora parontospora]GII09906.1 molybdopterin molybdenumtransferase MoeA [Planomonospora parontospora subsp. parontospora]